MFWNTQDWMSLHWFQECWIWRREESKERMRLIWCWKLKRKEEWRISFNEQSSKRIYSKSSKTEKKQVVVLDDELTLNEWFATREANQAQRLLFSMQEQRQQKPRECKPRNTQSQSTLPAQKHSSEEQLKEIHTAWRAFVIFSSCKQHLRSWHSSCQNESFWCMRRHSELTAFFRLK